MYARRACTDGASTLTAGADDGGTQGCTSARLANIVCYKVWAGDWSGCCSRCCYRQNLRANMPPRTGRGACQWVNGEQCACCSPAFQVRQHAESRCLAALLLAPAAGGPRRTSSSSSVHARAVAAIRLGRSAVIRMRTAGRCGRFRTRSRPYILRARGICADSTWTRRARPARPLESCLMRCVDGVGANEISERGEAGRATSADCGPPLLCLRHHPVAGLVATPRHSASMLVYIAGSAAPRHLRARPY